MGNAWCDVHRVAQGNPVVDAAAQDKFFDGVGDVDEASAAFHFEPKMLGQGLHA